MKARLVLPLILALLPAAAQTKYRIPDGSAITSVFFGTDSVTNWDYQVTVAGITHIATGAIHYVEGDPSATVGWITFWTAQAQDDEVLTNIKASPFTLGFSSFTASYTGQFTGTLTFNVYKSCSGRLCPNYLKGSFFTIK